MRARGMPRIVLPRLGQVQALAHDRARRPKVIAAAIVFLLFVLILNTCVKNHRLAYATDNSKQNAHAIQLAVERYSTDMANGTYPLNLNQIIGTGYLPEMPRNYFAGVLKRWPTLKSPRPMRPLMLGEYCPGDVLYLPQYDDPKEVNGYTLIVVMGNANPALAGAPLSIDTTQPVNSFERVQEINAAYRTGPQP